MIRYPFLEKNATIGVTAPSSGVSAKGHDLFKLACERMEEKGFKVVCGDTVWTQHKAKSAPAPVRGKEFNAMMGDEAIGMIFPPWGGELLIEMLEFVDFEEIERQSKWIMGYSDIGTLLLAVTLKTGLATAHGACFYDLRGEFSDETTGQWLSVLLTKAGGSNIQHSAPRYHKEKKQSEPSPSVFNLTEPVQWKTVSGSPETVKGRLLGGCVDVIRHLIGTPYGDVEAFQKGVIHDEPILWYLENCELNTADLRRSLVQMKLAGWFRNCSGLLFGRSAANTPFDGYTAEDMYRELAGELGVPVIYEVDFGHVPPQLTLINGAYAEIEVFEGKGTVRQHFLP
ncbi:S66 peptidase family protein [Paenibacillus sp. NPDC056722]|uniref:S66 family peptidase n=1 Tax=Paenibacillus sp. NPDC056722 TaxID=3345924 RepID=UPI0036C8B071